MYDRQCSVSCEYVRDILEWVLWKEKTVCPLLNMSPQLDKRRRLIEWTAGVAAQLELTTQTLHMAVRYLDLFMSGHSIETAQLYMVSACSLMLAAKMCERETMIPRISTMTKLLPYDTSSSDFRAIEMMILRFLDWNMNIPTSCYITELLLQYSIKASDLVKCVRGGKGRMKKKEPMYDSVREMKQEFYNAVKQMLDISITEDSMMGAVSSLMAVSVLQASRFVSGLPLSKDLEVMTGYGKKDYLQIVDCLVSVHKCQQDDDVVIIDEGYVSTSINASVNTTTEK